MGARPTSEKKSLRPGKKAGLAAVVLAAGLAAIGYFEGTRFTPYRDIAGIWTVCDGYTGPGIVPGVAWTKAQCAAQAEASYREAAATVATCVIVPLSAGEQVAYHDFVYNVGGGAFCRSSMARLANAGRRPEACAHLLRYVYVGKIDCRTAGKKCPGIVKRRQWEFDRCMEGVSNVQVAG